MLLLNDSKIDRSIAATRFKLLTGLVLLSLPFTFPGDWVMGGITGFTLIGSASISARFRNWRIEPGLWMLAIFVTLGFGWIWLFFEWHNLAGLFPGPKLNGPAKPAQWAELRFRVDGAIALVVFAEIVRFTASVAVRNWQWTRSPEARRAWLIPRSRDERLTQFVLPPVTRTTAPPT